MSHEMQILTNTEARSSAGAGERAAGIVPVARIPIHVRTATLADLPFLDALQKKNSKALGYFPTKQFEGYIGMGGVLVAEEKAEDRGSRIEDSAEASRSPALSSTLYPLSSPAHPAQALGYIISRDRYLKRDELGIIYQLCVAPGAQRGLIGASLVKAVFERAAYGCRLFCCWCAQDLEANYFWESLGFSAIAFRGGSSGKKRVHIFWQRRVREGDATTPWWFPAKTDSGAMRADRLVLPIPPGLSWHDAMPVIEAGETDETQGAKEKRALMDKRQTTQVGSKGGPQQPTRRGRPCVQFGPPPSNPVNVQTVSVTVGAQPAKRKKSRAKAEKSPCDPKLVSAARELRDRYLEQVNAPGATEVPGATGALATGGLTTGAKYDVARAGAGAGAIPGPQANMQFHPAPQRRLPAAA